MKKMIATLALAAAWASAWALPTVQQVEAEVRQGRTVQAESMMAEVVAAKPESARAHYVYAELLARNGKFAKAADETKSARQIDPDLTFTQPDKFAAFEQLLEREQRGAATARQQGVRPVAQQAPAAVRNSAAGSGAGGIPTWVWGAGIALIGFGLWRGLSRSRSVATGGVAGSGLNGRPAGLGVGPGTGPAGSASVGAVAPAAYPGSPYGGGQPAAAPGGGMLRTGAAVAGGIAGGMLLDEMLHRRGDANALSSGPAVAPGGVGPAQDVQPFADDPSNAAAGDLERRDVDFGTGGDWDTDAGSFDAGGGSDGGGGWD